jgi:hypothetical protein
MVKLKDKPSSRLGSERTVQPDAGPAGPRPTRGRRIRLLGFPGLVRRHQLFTLALLAGAVPRVMATVGFQPAILFRMDSYDYLWGAVHVSPDLVNPSGYSVFLWLLRPLHSLLVVAALQHLMGLGIAAMVYAVLRHYQLPAWGATLGAAPMLFNPSLMLLETLVMADLLAMVVMVAALTVLLLRQAPSLGRSVVAGLLMGISAIIRPTTVPLVIAIPVFLLLRRVGWRQAGSALVAGAMPVVGYMSWFAVVHGSFNMSESNGLFLWSRTMSFANCAVIKPPVDLRRLCPTAQRGRLAQPVPAKRPPPRNYLWNRMSWPWQDAATPGTVPDKVAFTPANNDRALRFALSAITAQPLAYASTIGREALQPFTRNDSTLHFPGSRQPPHALDGGLREYALASVSAYTGTTKGLAPDISGGYQFATRLRQPFAYLLNNYQRLVFLPGPGLGLIALAGLWGILIPCRRRAAAILLWLSAATIIVLPIAEHEYTYRYAIPAVPLLCIAAALAARKAPHPAATNQHHEQRRARRGAAPKWPEARASPPDPAGRCSND